MTARLLHRRGFGLNIEAEAGETPAVREEREVKAMCDGATGAVTSEARLTEAVEAMKALTEDSSLTIDQYIEGMTKIVESLGDEIDEEKAEVEKR